MHNTEPLLNAKLADVLRDLREKKWHSVNAEVRSYLPGGKQPDILIQIDERSDTIIEAEINGNPDRDAVKRLAECLAPEAAKAVHAVIAMNYPARFKNTQQAALERELGSTQDLQVAIRQSTGRNGETIRTPENGFLPMSARQLAAVIDHVAQPADAIEKAARKLTDAAENVAEQIGRSESKTWPGIEQTLHQEEDGRVHLMAASIISNALLFQESITGIKGKNGRKIRATEEMLVRRNGSRKNETLKEWEFILSINYWPIFEIARNLIQPLETQLAGEILKRLTDAACSIRDLGAHSSQDFTGLVFQKLIADRKLLATFYTLPASAEFLAELTMPDLSPEKMQNARIGDFACGTGTLLSAACQKATTRILEGSALSRKTVHRTMMEHMSTGLDVLPPAVHLTATLLSSACPGAPYRHTNIHLMAYGRARGKNNIQIGSLDLLGRQKLLPLSNIAGPTGKSMSGTSSDPREVEAGSKSFDWIVMNPPFTRNNNHAAKRAGIPLPAFAGMGNEEEEQKAMNESLKDAYKGEPKPYAYDGGAGLATPFIDLTRKKLKTGGTLAMIVPLSLANAANWKNARMTIAKHFRNVTIVTIRQGHPDGTAFSASTGMGECILYAQKKDAEHDARIDKAAQAIVLNEPPRNPLRALLAAQQIRAGNPKSFATIREFKVEPDGRPWGTVNSDDTELPEIAEALKQGQTDGNPIPMTELGEIARIGPYALDVHGWGGPPKQPHRGPFEKVELGEDSPPPQYHALMNHDHALETCLERDVPYNMGLKIRGYRKKSHKQANEKKAKKIWAMRSHIHWNQDFRFNSQATSCILTRVRTVGTGSWPGIQLDNPKYRFPLALWLNSTLGILAYWHQSSRQQDGRGRIAFKAAMLVPVLDLRKLSPDQLDKAEAIVKALRRQPMKPVNEIDRDPVRKELDERLCSDVLGLPANLHEPGGFIEMLREKLAREPSIQGGKKRSG